MLYFAIDRGPDGQVVEVYTMTRVRAEQCMLPHTREVYAVESMPAVPSQEAATVDGIAQVVIDHGTLVSQRVMA